VPSFFNKAKSILFVPGKHPARRRRTFRSRLGYAPVVTQLYTQGDLPALPGNDADLSSTFSALDISGVAADDASRVLISGTSNLVQQFKVKNSNNTDQINISWNGQTSIAPSSNTVYLQIYNRTTAAWETLSSNGSAAADTDFTLLGTKSSSLTDYYDSNFFVSLRVYQGPAFTPAQLSNIRHWWNAKQLVLTNLDPVSLWDDPISSSSFFAFGGPQPVYHAGSGNPYVEFDGVTDSMAASIADLTDYTVVGIYERVSSSSFGRFMESSGSGIIICQDSTNNAELDIPAFGASISIARPAAPTGYMAVLAERIGSAGRFRVNGTEGTATVSTTSSGTSLKLGSDNGGTQNGNLRVKEVIVCDGAIVGTDLTKLTAYVLSNYGLTL
jgi:hypothetical protein